MMLNDAIDEYLANRRRHVRPDTLSNETKTLRVFLAEVGNLQLKNLKASHVERFFYGGDEDDENAPINRLEPGSFNNILQHVRSLLAWAERRGYVRRNLLEEVRARKVIIHERIRLSPSQLLALLDFADTPRDRAVLAVAMNTGLRAKDIADLRVGDVNLESGRLRTRISKSYLEDSKPISSDLDRELRRWLVYYEAAQKDTFRQTLQAPWYLLPVERRWTLLNNRDGKTYAGSKFYPERSICRIERVAKRALEGMGLDGPGEGLHTIRRSVALAYFESLRSQGYDGALIATKDFLNHADTKITERYLGLSHERQVRDETIAGKPFLSGMVSGENVVRIADAVRHTEAR